MPANKRKSGKGAEFEVEISADQLERVKLLKDYNFLNKETRRLVAKLDTVADIQLKKVYADAAMDSLRKLECSYMKLGEEEMEDKSDSFYEVKDKCLEIKMKLTESVVVPNRAPDTQASSGNLNVRLPRLGLPEFHGEMQGWLTFKDVFTNVIIKNAELTDLQRLSYLQSCVKGDAARLIKGFEITNDNFSNAWQSLTNRYQNSKELTFAHLKRILELKVIKSASAKNLLEMVDILNESLRNLKTLGLETDKFSETMILYHMQTKLDTDTLKQWELQTSSTDIAELKVFIEFLEKQARSFQATLPTTYKLDPKPTRPTLVTTSVNVQAVPTCKCPLCREDHPLFRCHQFTSATLKDRWALVKAKRLCSNCLKGNHFAKQCASKSRCRNCHKSHHTTLHSYNVDLDRTNGGKGQTVANPEREEAKGSEEGSMTIPCLSVNATVGSHTLLSTARIQVRDGQGNWVKCRALVDNGSQKTLISKAAQDRLNLVTTLSRHAIQGINNTRAETSLAEATLEFAPHFKDCVFSVEALIVTNITPNLPNFGIKWEDWPHLNNLILADPEFHLSAPIDILLGADIFVDLMIGNPIMGPPGSPSAISTHLGFLLSGSIFSSKRPQATLSCPVTLDLSSQLEKFWELESVPEDSTLSAEDALCEEIYKSSVTRDDTGRYCMSLPFKPNITLGDTYYQALRRLYHVESKCRDNPELKEQYRAFMKEYLEMHHMEPVPCDDHSSRVHYLPHHGVMNINSLTTRLRVVFDGSTKTNTGYSLNDALLKGPKLQRSLFGLLLQFRCYPIALNADVMKMYRQILISPEDTNMQRILWRFSPNDEVQEFRLLTVTYGLSVSPFLALRTLQQLAEDEQEGYPEATEMLKAHFYMDDLLGGAQDVNTAKVLVNQLQALMSRGGFVLRKWASNQPDVLSDIPENLKSVSECIDISEEPTQNLLGLTWNPSADTLNINLSSCSQVSSKRSLLSLIAKIFDPLGILAPATVTLKILLQELWKLKSDWDQPLSPEIMSKWKKFEDSMEMLKTIKVPRCLTGCLTGPPISQCQLIGFADASLKAYAAVLYLRVVQPSQEVSVTFVTAKTRVAPTKATTLPRLELSAALLLSQLVNTAKASLNLNISHTYLWSDSQIVLCWIASSQQQRDAFVSHRVKKIQAWSPEAVWSYVSSEENPADCASRGLNPKQLVAHSLWWAGPPWLKDYSLLDHLTSPRSDSTDGPPSANEVELHTTTALPELVGTQLLVNSDFHQILIRYSSYPKVVRILAWILRAVHNFRLDPDKRTGPLRSTEIYEATKWIVKIIQSTEFPKEIRTLQQGQDLPTRSKLSNLNVFLDSEGILRVGGRLCQSKELSYDRKHPMLLPPKHHITTLLINYLHLKHLHSGTQLVLSFLRQQFWIVNGRSIIRNILHRCLTCFRLHAKPCSQIMGNLPSDRITLVKPFSTVGIDFSGAFLTKPNLPRSRVKIKSYICLFICMATKAIHLELVSELSTSCFLASLKRFISRRGLPTAIYSDNATNFRGAASHLQQIHQICRNSVIQSFCSDQMVSWHFIPAYSPNFGGLWEASIKLTKSHLLRVCKTSLLNFEQLSTLLCQIEAILNSRPLLPLSSDTRDLRTLTPAHFLIGTPLVDLPINPPSDRNMNLSAKWKLIQDMRQHFWMRWSIEYLNHLQPRTKWARKHDNLKPGQLVLIHEPKLPAMQWMTGRILQVCPGSDGQVRVAILQTRKGIIKRSISKLTRLPDAAAESVNASTSAGPEDVGSRITRFSRS